MVIKNSVFRLSSLVVLFFTSILPAQWLETTVTVGNRPNALVYNSVDNKIYCANEYDNNLTVIDGATNDSIATIQVGGRPLALVYNPSGNRVYSADYYTTVTVIDGAGDSVITRIDPGGGGDPGPLVYNPAHNKLYSATYLGSFIHVYDGAGDSVITWIPVGGGNHLSQQSLAYNPTYDKVYCANEGNDNVTVIDCAADSVITTIAVGAWPVAVVYDSNNDKIYCANRGSGNVTVIDGATDSVITTITVGDYPWALTWNPLYNRTYVANYLGSSVSVIRDATGIEEGDEIAALLDRLGTRNDITIYPNPAQSVFTVHSLTPLHSIRIYNILGELVKTEDVSEFRKERRVSLKQMSAGVYFLKVKTNDKEFIKKLIVTK